MSTLSDLFHKRMASFEAELPKTQSTPSITSLSSDYLSFKEFVIQAMNNVQQQINLLMHTVDSVETRSRRKMLLLHGVSETNQEDLADVVVKVVKQHLNMPNFTARDIRRCHRMGRSSAGHKPRPIVIKFETTDIRDGLWFAKTKFKGSGITVSEFLTKLRHEVFMAARQKFGVSQSWTREGVVFVIGRDGARNRISSLMDLHKVDVQDGDKPAASDKASRPKRNIVHKK